MRNKMELSFIIMLTLSTFFLFFFSQIGTYVYDVAVGHGSGYAEGTIVGSVDISGLTKEEAEDKVSNAILAWQNESIITLAYSEYSQSVNNQMFIFDVKSTIENVKEGQQIPLSVSADDALFTELWNQASLEEVNKTSLKKDLLDTASMLGTDQQTFNLLSYLEKPISNLEIVATSELSGISQYPDLVNLVNALPEINIPSEKKVSLTEILGESDISLSTESLNIFSSLLYKLILPTNFEIVERQISVNKPATIEIGFEALVVPNEIDFSFMNPNANGYKIKLENKNNQLVVTLLGHPLFYEYKIRTSSLETFEPKTIIQYSALLTKGSKVVQENGSDGYRVKVTKEIIGQNGDLHSSQEISTDFYAPIHKVVVISTLDGTNNQQETDNNGPEETDEEDVGEGQGRTEDADDGGTEGSEQEDGKGTEDSDQEEDDGDLFDIPGKEVPEK